jgi:hypothetical protein
MRKWWKSGFKYAKSKREVLMSEFRPDVLTDQEIEKRVEGDKNSVL